MYMVIRFLENESALCLSFRLLYDYVFTQCRTWPSPVDWLPTEHWFLVSTFFPLVNNCITIRTPVYSCCEKGCIISHSILSVLSSALVHLFLTTFLKTAASNESRVSELPLYLQHYTWRFHIFFKPNHNGLRIKYRLNLSFLMSCQEGKLWRMHARFGAFNSSELSVFFDCKISRSIQIIRKCECSISCVTIFLHVFFKQRIVRLTIAPAHRLQKNSRRNGIRVLTTKTLAATFLSFKLSC